MTRSLHILLLEDSAVDAELNERALRKAGIEFVGQRVERCEDFVAALQEFQPDVILADYKLPSFDGLQALVKAREQAPHVPFIFVTGAMGEEFAVETLKQGATDYILKDRITRLPAAVQRALKEKRAQQAQKEAEEKFRLIFEGANDGIVLVDESGGIVNCNPEFVRQTGYALDELRQMKIWELRPVEQVAPARNKFAAIWRGGKGGAEDLDFRRSDGSLVPIEFRTTALHIGGARYLQSITRDITERRRAEQALLRSETKFRTVFESSNDAIMLLDGGVFFDCNPAALRIFGCQHREDFIGKTPAEFSPSLQSEGQESMQLVNDYITQAMQQGSVHFDWTHSRLDGAAFPADVLLTALELDGRHVVQATVRDITEQRRSQEALRQSEERYHQLVENMGSGVVLFQPDADCGRFIIKSVNHAVERIEHVSREHLLGNDVEVMFPGVREFGLTDVMERVCRYGKSEHMMPAHYKDERIDGWRENYVYRLQSGEVVAVYDDVTERVAREAHVRRLNNTLRTINACNQLLVHATRQQQLLADNCKILVDMGGYLAAWFGLVGADAEMNYAAHHVREQRTMLAHDPEIWHERSDCAKTMLGLLRDSRRPVVVQDIALDPRTRSVVECARHEGILSAVALPFMAQEKEIGAMILLSDRTLVFDDLEMRLLEELADDIAYGVEALRVAAERNKYMTQLSSSLQMTIAAIARTLEKRDPYTAGHQTRVATLAVAIARELGLPEYQIEGLSLGGMIHDLGKIAVPAEILAKPGTLTELEYRLIQIHPQAGLEILKGIEFPWPIADIVVQHHERLDGSGYPAGLRNGQICLEARILAVADVVEAMASHRPYRAAMSQEMALAELESHKGERYDPEVVDACVRLLRGHEFVWSAQPHEL